MASIASDELLAHLESGDKVSHAVINEKIEQGADLLDVLQKHILKFVSNLQCLEEILRSRPLQPKGVAFLITDALLVVFAMEPWLIDSYIKRLGRFGKLRFALSQLDYPPQLLHLKDPIEKAVKKATLQRRDKLFEEAIALMRHNETEKVINLVRKYAFVGTGLTGCLTLGEKIFMLALELKNESVQQAILLIPPAEDGMPSMYEYIASWKDHLDVLEEPLARTYNDALARVKEDCAITLQAFVQQEMSNVKMVD